MKAAIRTRPGRSTATSRYRAGAFFGALLALLVAVFLVEPVPAYDVCSDDGACIHEYMAEQALALFSNSEINDHFTNQIKVGTGHEDEFDHIFSLSWLAQALVTITHFWDSDNGPDDPVENTVGSFPNNWHKVKSYWALALGAYANGEKDLAYHWLGHVVHQMGDNTLPTHVHDDMHWPDDDAFEDWMSELGLVNAGLSDAEKAALLAAGPIEIPADQPDKLYWLLYTTNQIADFFCSDDYDGDAVDPLGWVQAELDTMAATIPSPRTVDDCDNNEDDSGGIDDDNNDDGDLGVIRQHSYLRGIRAIAALYKLFAEQVGQVSAVIVIDTVSEVDDDHDTLDGADYWSRVMINGRVAQNRGDEVEDTEDISPGWEYGHVVGVSGTIPMWLEIWDHDGEGEDAVGFGGGDDQSDITPGGGLRLNFDLDIAKCLNGEAGAITGEVTGNCRDVLSTTGNNDDEASAVTFRVFMSKSPPSADAGGPYTTPEGTDVTLDAGGTTDPDNDIVSYEWDLDGDGACDDAAGTTTTFSAVGQDGVTTVKVCVTDAVGLTDEDTAQVTVTNVTPSISLGSDSPNDEGSTTTVTGTVTDPGWLDVLSATVSWGDGTGLQVIAGSSENNRPDATFTFTIGHVYGDNGIFTAEVCASDDDSTPCQTIVLQSDNVTPTTAIDMSGAVPVNGTPTFIVHAGEPLDLDGRSTDPGSDDLTLTWDFGDGTPGPIRLSLVNPPFADPAVSPSVQPRDVTDLRSHAYAEACVYLITFSSRDDDGDDSAATANVVIVGNGDNTGQVGYWNHQFRSYNTGNGKPDFTASELTCYLAIARYMSLVFGEARPLSTFVQAEDVLRTNGTSDPRELFDQHLLAVWLNFADGTIEFDNMVDTNDDHVPNSTVLEALAAAEAVRMNPASTAQELTAQKNVLAHLLQKPKN